MARKTKSAAIAVAEPITPNEIRRAERVLVSQGLARGRLASLPTELVREIAKLYGDHGVVIGAREKFRELWHGYHDSQKAVAELPEV